MRVPVFEGQSRISFGDRPEPEAGPGQLLIEVKANALCGSERGQFTRGTPVTPGHEAAGIVIAAGPQTSIPAGTRGVIFLMDFCGECRSCRLGYTNQCLCKRGDMGFNRDGGYGPQELVSETIFFPIDEDLSYTEGTLLLDIMGTGGHALERARQVRPDIDSLLVTGAGPIGLGVLAMAKILFGFDLPVLLTDFVPYRLQLAEQLGGLPILLSQTSLEQGLKQHGFDHIPAAIDTTGKSAARQDALDRLDRRGALVCVGHGEGLSLEVSRDLIAPERAALGSEYFRFDELTANLERLHTHREYLGQIITHRFAVDEIQQAFELFFAGGTGKVVIEQ